MIVNLSVHKNNKAQRHAKHLRRNMIDDTKAMMTHDLNGYAIVSWNNKGRCNVSWTLGNTDPTAMPDKVRNAIIRVQTMRDMKDD